MLNEKTATGRRDAVATLADSLQAVNDLTDLRAIEAMYMDITVGYCVQADVQRMMEADSQNSDSDLMRVDLQLIIAITEALKERSGPLFLNVFSVVVQFYSCSIVVWFEWCCDRRKCETEWRPMWSVTSGMREKRRISACSCIR